MIAVVDNLIAILKSKIMADFFRVLQKAQRGYPLEKYKTILDAMFALEFIEDYEMPDKDKIRILERHIFKLDDEE